MRAVASRIRSAFRGLPSAGAAAVAAVLLVLPAVAGATSVHSQALASTAGGHAADIGLGVGNRLEEFLDALRERRDDFRELATPRPQDPDDVLADDPFDRGRFGLRSLLFASLFEYCPPQSSGPEPNAVPEPGTGLLLAGGLIALTAARRARTGRAA